MHPTRTIAESPGRKNAGQRAETGDKRKKYNSTLASTDRILLNCIQPRRIVRSIPRKRGAPTHVDHHDRKYYDEGQREYSEYFL